MTKLIDIDSAIFEGAPRVNLSRRAIISGIAAGTMFPFISGCETNPATGRSQLLLFGDQEVASMAASAWTDMKAQTPVTANSQLKTSAPAMAARRSASHSSWGQRVDRSDK